MPSSYTPSLRLEEQGIGENNNTWGDKLNKSLELIDKSIAGHVSVAVASGDVVLTSVNNAEDQARYKIIELTGTLTDDVVVQVPAVSKEYTIWDSTTRGGFTIDLRLGGAGNTVSVPATTASGFSVGTDGTDWRSSASSPATTTSAGAVELLTDAEAQTGTDTERAMTAANLQAVTATESRKGVLELLTDAEAQAGVDTERAMTAANLQAVTATTTRKGVVELLTDAEAQTGTDTERALTAANLQAVTATTARKGVIELATQSEVDTGADTARAVVPSTLKTVLDTRLATTGNLGNAAQATTGPGNGLDADTVDGIQGSSLVQTSRTISAGGGLTGGGSLAANRTISHADTSSQGSVNNSGTTFIQDITLDGYGHVTNIGSATVPGTSTSASAVGTYGMFVHNGGTTQVNFGATVSGSVLTPANVDGGSVGSSQPGTWRCMGYVSNQSPANERTTLFVRIS